MRAAVAVLTFALFAGCLGSDAPVESATSDAAADGDASPTPTTKSNATKPATSKPPASSRSATTTAPPATNTTTPPPPPPVGCATKGELLNKTVMTQSGGMDNATFVVAGRCALNVTFQVNAYVGTLEIRVRAPGDAPVVGFEGMGVGHSLVEGMGSTDGQPGAPVPEGVYTYAFSSDLVADFVLAIRAEDA